MKLLAWAVALASTGALAACAAMRLQDARTLHDGFGSVVFIAWAYLAITDLREDRRP